MASATGGLAEQASYQACHAYQANHATQAARTAGSGPRAYRRAYRASPPPAHKKASGMTEPDVATIQGVVNDPGIGDLVHKLKPFAAHYKIDLATMLEVLAAKVKVQQRKEIGRV